jgi:hypothetical protein
VVRYSLAIRCLAMPNLNTVVSALLAYTTAVLEEKGASNSVIRSVKDASSNEVLLNMAGMS